MSSVKYLAAMRDATEGEDPIYLGIGLADYTVTELKEALKASPTSQHDIPAIEHSRRFVRVLGIFEQKSDIGLNAQKLRGKAKLNIRVPSGKALPSFWVWNRSGGPMTTGAIVPISATYYGQWR